MTPKQMKEQAAREHMARSAESVLAAARATGPARATEIAIKAGVSLHQARASLFSLQADGLVIREQGEGHKDPVIWTVIGSEDLPPEYVKVSSIFRVGDRVAAMAWATA